MLTVEAALSRILAAAPAPRREAVAVPDALGLHLSGPVLATMDLPPWANSAMDGFAVRAADTPGRLVVLETIAAGAVPRATVGAGTASRIMTGAPIPPGADAVVMIEDCTTEGDQVQVPAARPGQHVRARGSDVRAGAEVLAAGRRLGPGALGLLASFGHTTVEVYARPRVAVISTGDEVVQPGTALGPGQIYSSNNVTLAALVAEAGGVPVDLGNCLDDPAALHARFTDAARCADLVVSTGGVSVGDFDHVKDVLGAVDFWRVAMKPGKPLAFGRFGDRPFFGLPGNPVSCMVNFLQFVRPVVRTMLGDPSPFLPVVSATLTRPVRRAPGRVEFLRVRLSRDAAGTLWASPTGGHQGSGNVAGMADAHGFALLDATRTEVSGDVSVQVFDGSYDARESAGYTWGTQPDADPRRCC